MNSSISVDEEDAHSQTEMVGDASEIVSSISKFYNNEELSDIVLKLGSQRFHAHKFVLLLMSDVFQTMCSKRWDTTQVAEIEINECEQCVPVFSMFLHFLYHGQVPVKTTTALPLLMLADKYNVQPLKAGCESYIRKQVEGGNVVGAIRWLPYLQLCGHQDLEKTCVEVIIVEMDFIVSCDEFLLLSFELLVHLLERNDIVISCEFNLYMAVVKWITEKESDDAIEQYVDSLISQIRFSMMFPSDLVQIERSSFYSNHKDKIFPYLALAHRYRSLIPDVIDEAFSGVLYQPRNYTHQTWCHFMSLDADNTSFFNKSFNLQLACDPLPSASKPSEPTWQFQVCRNEKRDGSSVGSSRSEPNHWHSRSPVIFPSSPSNTGYCLPLQVLLRSLKPISSDVIVEVSLFRLKNDRICKHLDSATLTPSESHSNKGLSRLRPKQVFCFPTKSQEKMFQPSPMHFTFTAPQVAKEHEVTLKHNFVRSDLDSPPEVPCVQFGPGFSHSVRPIHCIKLAVIVKPRYKSPAEFASSNNMSDSPSAVDDSLPLLG